MYTNVGNLPEGEAPSLSPVAPRPLRQLVREERLTHDVGRDWLGHVRSLALSIEELVVRIHAYGPAAVANRKLTAPTREDLEVLLADLMALEANGGR